MIECSREPDVLDAIVSTRWPVDLRTHVERCPACRDLAMVAAALREEGQAARDATPLPTSGQVWWRVTMRTRADAARAAARPITALQALSAACALAVFAALLTRLWSSVGQWMIWAEQALAVVALQQLLVVGLVLSGAVILAPFVFYYVLSDD
jgi:hypothetical protein